MSELTWSLKIFDELTTNELYNILKVRSEVFVVEQDCVYLDSDDKDQKSYHLSGIVDGKLMAYARLIPPGVSYKEASIGRVLTHPSYRSNGAGILLMKEAISTTLSLFNTNEIKIGAQLYLLNFYSNLGFKQSSEQYLEDNIQHIEMLLTK